MLDHFVMYQTLRMMMDVFLGVVQAVLVHRPYEVILFQFLLETNVMRLLQVLRHFKLEAI